MTTLQAIILGIIEGLTEFLPVSSTGHLLVAQRLLGIPENDASKAFVVCIQLGAILAVVSQYPRRIQLVARGVAGHSPEGRKLFQNLTVAFLPAAFIGLLFDDLIEEKLFGPWPVIVAWIVGGIVILTIGRRITQGKLGVLELTPRHALWIGLAQCLAMWPGTSRSLVTILGALALGASMTAAVEFSFLLGLMTLSAASGYKLLTQYDVLLANYGITELLLGLGAATVSAWLSVRWMVSWLSGHGLALFGWWRILVGVAAALLITMSFGLG